MQGQERRSILSSEGALKIGVVAQFYAGARQKSIKKAKICPSFVMGIMARRTQVQ